MPSQVLQRPIPTQPPSNPTLEACLFAAATGDRRAFRAVYDASCTRLLAVALQHVRRRDVAEDILQEAYLRIWTAAASFDPARGRAITWMVRIVRNTAIDWHRRDRPHDDVADHAEALQTEPVPVARTIDVLRALATLQAGPREAVRLALLEGYTCTEIADRLGVRLGTAKSWIGRGARRLRTRFAA